MEDSTARFDGLAETYDAYRRPYPPDLFRDLAADVPQGTFFALDVGAGTGIATEGLLDALPSSWMVIGVEPGSDMRRVLTRRLRGRPNFQANPSHAEAIRLPDRSAGLLTAFTAIQWFDQQAFFDEARRLLVPGGILALGRNKRRQEGVVSALDAFLVEASAERRDLRIWEKVKTLVLDDLAALKGFGRPRLRRYAWEETVRGRDLLDLYLTRPIVDDIVREIGLPAFRRRFEEIVAAHHGDSPFLLRWEATLLSVVRE